MGRENARGLAPAEPSSALGRAVCAGAPLTAAGLQLGTGSCTRCRGGEAREEMSTSKLYLKMSSREGPFFFVFNRSYCIVYNE